MLEPDERYPDGTFVEDTAVVSARVAVATRPGAPTRTGEVPAVAAALRQFRPDLESIAVPGTLDGGDVCQVDDHFLIGISAHQEAGARWRVLAPQYLELPGRHGRIGHRCTSIGRFYLGGRRFTVTAV